jgi:pimeloyl-ACP methyl ester carboxylesterase
MIGTWTAPNGKKFWELVDDNDQIHGKTDAFAYGFPSHYLKSGSFDIQEAANNLHERLEFHQVLNYPAVVFVAHSMGGLVVMRELLTHREILSKVPVVMFYATPMEGSLIAEIGREFSPNSAFAEMTPADGNKLLQLLDSEWKTVPENQRPHIKCAYENTPIGPAKIVPWSSATKYCEGATAPLKRRTSAS